MFIAEPKLLEPSATIQGFTPESMGLWIIAYAGPCAAVDCKNESSHEQLYLIPMIGWQHVASSIGFELRPAIMSTAGTVTDYLDVPAKFRFIAVLQDSEDVIQAAYAVYRLRFGEDARLDMTTQLSALAN